MLCWIKGLKETVNDAYPSFDVESKPITNGFVQAGIIDNRFKGVVAGYQFSNEVLLHVLRVYHLVLTLQIITLVQYTSRPSTFYIFICLN